MSETIHHDSEPGSPVIVSQRFGGYPAFHACLAGHEGIWECGHHAAEAVERLFVTHPSKRASWNGRILYRGLVANDLREMADPPDLF